MIEENILKIYTDGSQFSNPRRGGFAIRIIYVDDVGNEEIQEAFNSESFIGVTNNQMELMACVQAIKEAERSKHYEKVRKVIIFTDSMYVSNNYKTAMFVWAKKKWMTKNGNPVANADIWKKLIKAVINSSKRIDIQWVKGHSKDIHNRAVDKLAKKSAKSVIRVKPLSIVNVRKKLTNQKTNIGSVEMKGQKLRIRIITDEYLKTQKINKYRYEVTSKRSRYFGFVDFMYSELFLKAGHEYLVTFNKNEKAPRLKRVIEEIEKT